MRVAIDAGRIAAVVPAAASAADRALGDAQSEFDARGCGVTPGEMLRA